MSFHQNLIADRFIDVKKNWRALYPYRYFAQNDYILAIYSMRLCKDAPDSLQGKEGAEDTDAETVDTNDIKQGVLEQLESEQCNADLEEQDRDFSEMLRKLVAQSRLNNSFEIKHKNLAIAIIDGRHNPFFALDRIATDSLYLYSIREDGRVLQLTDCNYHFLTDDFCRGFSNYFFPSNVRVTLYSISATELSELQGYAHFSIGAYNHIYRYGRYRELSTSPEFDDRLRLSFNHDETIFHPKSMSTYLTALNLEGQLMVKNHWGDPAWNTNFINYMSLCSKVFAVV